MELFELAVSHQALFKLLRSVFTEASSAASPRNPVAVVLVEVAPGCIDVNLEPNKTQVLIKDEEKIMLALQRDLEAYYAKAGEAQEETPRESPDVRERRQEANPALSEEPPKASPSLPLNEISHPNTTRLSDAGDGRFPVPSSEVKKPLMTSNQVSQFAAGDANGSIGQSNSSSSMLQSSLDSWATGRVSELPEPPTTLKPANRVRRSADGTVKLTPPPPLPPPARRQRRGREAAALDTDDQTRSIEAFLAKRTKVVNARGELIEPAPPRPPRPVQPVKERSRPGKGPGNLTLDRLAQPMGTPQLSSLQSAQVRRREVRVRVDLGRMMRGQSKGKEKESARVLGQLEEAPYWICKYVLVFVIHRASKQFFSRSFCEEMRKL